MRTDYLKFAHRAPATSDGVEEYIQSVSVFYKEYQWLRDWHTGAFVGIVQFLTEHFSRDNPPGPLMLAAQQSANSLAPTLSAPQWNDHALAQWAASSGESYFLTEVIRRAVHRDGSNEADVAGSDMIGLLVEAREVDPALVAAMTQAGVDLGAVKFGKFPRGSYSLVAKVAPNARVQSARGSAVPAAAPVIQDVPPRSINGPAQADHSAGTVRVGSAVLSISNAIKLRESINMAVVDLLRPAEGFAWLDDSADPQARSILVDLDGIRGEGLQLGAGGMVQAEVIQIAARGPDVNAGKYIGRIYNRANGYADFSAETDDMNVAKFKVAERVRMELPKT